MCGIYGVFRFDSKAVDPAVLTRMGRAIAHRGPDDQGLHVDGNCGIGMRRLSIIDPAGGHQPISNQDDTSWVVCNGEIYNFRELRAELSRDGYRFKTGSDSEVILHLYDALGDDFVNRLEGMFDFALWDARRRRLLIGRDALGVKPLYLYRSPRLIAFATEAKALLTLPEVSVGIDQSVLVDYLHLGYVSAPHSLFRGITKVLPATLIAIEGGRVEEHRFWRLPERIDTACSEQDWVARIRQGIEQAVHKQMVSDVPIGAFLSGGVDSSAVVAFMARHSDRPIRTYAIGFEGGKAEALYNELPYARQVATRFGTEHREIVVRPDVVDLLPKLVWHMDEPIADSASITTYLVSKFAREDVKVILSGVGGDELFGGYRRYLGDHYLAMLERLPPGLVRAASGVVQRLPSDRHGRFSNLSRLARQFLASAELSPDERYRAYLQVLSRERAQAMMAGKRSAGGPASDPAHAAADALGAALDGAGASGAGSSGASRSGAGWSRAGSSGVGSSGAALGGVDSLGAAFAQAAAVDPVARLFAVDAATQLPDDLLMLTDKMSMAVSLECRVPLLDQQLVELAAGIPASMKIKGGRPKYLMKEALKDVLPQDILHRKKRGFGTPMGAWLKGTLAGSVETLLSRESVNRRGLFRPAEIERLVADHRASRIDGTDAILALMNLEIWCRVFLDRRSQDDVSDELLEKAA